MAFLNLKKNKTSITPKDKKEIVVKDEKRISKETKEIKAEKALFQVAHIHRIILNPRITEKASSMVEGDAYTFNVSSFANKRNVKEEIARIYKVTPIAVRITKVPGKVIFSRGKKGSRKAGKKAYVTLKKGEKIEFV